MDRALSSGELRGSLARGSIQASACEPPEAVYEYVVASIDVGLEKLQVQVDGRTIEEYDYAMR